MTIKNVTIIGAGTMGSGIAIALAQKGCSVQIVDISMDAIDRALNRAQVFYARQVEKGRMDEQTAGAAHTLLSGSTDFEIAANADLVIEAVFEDLDLKLETFGKLNDIVREDAFLATNTSCLKVGDIAEAVDNPGRFLSLHYFSPAEISPLVEIVKGEETDTATIEEMNAFCVDTGKQPLLCRDQNGFAVNRFFCPYTNEAVLLHEEGLGTTGQIDRIAKEAVGAAGGPFLVMNLVKPRINLHAIQNISPLGAFYEPAKSMITMGEADTDWEIEEVDSISANDGTIQDRLRGAVFFAILDELDEDVATPDDIDMGASLALKFARTPCALMDELGSVEVERLIQPICQRHDLELPKSLSNVGRLCE